MHVFAHVRHKMGDLNTCLNILFQNIIEVYSHTETPSGKLQCIQACIRARRIIDIR